MRSIGQKENVVAEHSSRDLGTRRRQSNNETSSIYRSY